jgi:hypothetical protein
LLKTKPWKPPKTPVFPVMFTICSNKSRDFFAERHSALYLAFERGNLNQSGVAKRMLIMAKHRNFKIVIAIVVSGLFAIVIPSIAPSMAAKPKAAKPISTSIGHIGMKLFYGYSGTLSQDISPPAEFVGWNSIIGEGDAGEAVDDLLVTVHLRGKSETNIFAPVSIVATDGKRKVVGRRIAEPVLANEKGEAAVALFLHDVGCAGALTVTAKMGASVKSETINLDCGE